MSTPVGIDLGTTYSAIAYVDEDGRPVVIPSPSGERTTPSAVCFRDGDVLVGQEAKDILALGLAPGMMFFKRAMGLSDAMCITPERSYTATELSTIVLERLKQQAEEHLGRPVREAVITVPAYFRDPERLATIAAGEAAGLEVLRVINEPTAAAVAYGITGAEGRRTVVVYDFGGGTFDVTLLRIGPDGIDVVASDGSKELGGKDLDDCLIEHLASRFEDEFGCNPEEDPESFADLRQRVEEAKHQLSDRNEVTVTLIHQGHRGRYVVVREEFERLTGDLMERTIALTASVLAEAGLRSEDVDDVLLVGGSTRMPMVRAYIEREFGQPATQGVDVDEVVATGAALVAAQISAQAPALLGLASYNDVANHSLGMIAINEDHSAYVNSIILPKNLVLPCSETRPYKLATRPGQDNELEIFLTQGETDDPADVSYLGRYRVRNVPHDASGAAVLDIEYSYGVSGTMEVACSVSGTGARLEVEVGSLPEDVPGRFLRPPVLETAAAARHMTAYLAFDLSGSMRGTPLDKAREAALGFLENTDLAHSSLGIIAFSDEVAVKLEATQNAKEIEAAIRALACGETGYGNQTDPFREILAQGKKAQDSNVFAVVLADGVWCDQELATKRARQCHAQGLEVIAIGFGGADQEFLRSIASCDETAYFTPLEGLTAAFSTIAQVLTRGGDLRPVSELGSDLQLRLGGGRT